MKVYLALMMTAIVITVAPCVAQTNGPDQSGSTDPHARAKEAARLHSSELYMTAPQTLRHEVHPEKWHSTLESLFAKSDIVALVHIASATVGLSPNGKEPITFYSASILKQWKGANTQTKITFAIPGGVLPVDREKEVRLRVDKFMPPQPGSRMVLFLRFAANDELSNYPALMLTGDGVQGAFDVQGEYVEPTYQADSLGGRLRQMPASTLLQQMDNIAAISKRDGHGQ